MFRLGFRNFRSPSLLLLLTGAITLLCQPFTSAQIIPDRSLPNEQSTVQRNISVNGQTSDRIDGGARRGENLFHSFSEFNVDDGQRVYFANPEGVDRIFSRVTGTSRSDILGTLGVLGNADLFLLNPNGILFGPNAQLDIRGSFLATTANRLTFSDGSLFAAVDPQAPPLLTIGVPLGLQYGTNPQAEIANVGRLTVGQNLTLAAGNLDLQGQLRAGRNLSLQAQNTVRIRGEAATPFLARSIGDLTIQGHQGIDIFALNSLQPALQSGGDLSLISDGRISLDAHVASGGNFAVRTLAGDRGSFVSLVDPVFTVGGNYSIGDYTGPSLQVVAGGNIDYGAVVVNSIDPAVDPDQPAFLLTAGGSITGGDVSTTVPTGRLRVEFEGAGDISTQAITTQGGAISLTSRAGSITTNGAALNTTNGMNDGGTIALNAFGNINIGDAYTFACAGVIFCGNTDANAGNGGDIRLAATTGDITTGALDSKSYSNLFTSGNGGAISLAAPNGSITIFSLFTGADSDTASAGNGGTVNITARGDIALNNYLFSSSIGADFGFASAGNGGEINVTTTNGNITARLLDSSSAAYRSGQGGRIRLAAPNDSIGVDELLSFSRGGASAGDAGAIDLAANNDIRVGLDGDLSFLIASSEASAEDVATAGNGGAVSMTSSNGNINVTTSSSSIISSANSQFASASSGNGGEVRLRADNGSIHFSSFNSSTAAFGQPNSLAGNGGAITLSAGNDINGEALRSNASSGEGGKIRVTANQDITIRNLNTSTFADSLAGNAGEIEVTSLNGNIAAIDMNIFANSSSPFSASNGGNIRLSAPNGSITVDRIFAFSQSRTAVLAPGGRGGSINLNARGDIRFNELNSVGQLGSGNITLTTRSDIAAGNITSDTFGAGRGGNIQLTTQAISLANGAQISASTHSSGQGGNITINAASLDLSGIRTPAPGAIPDLPVPGGIAIVPTTTALDLGGYVPVEDASRLFNVDFLNSVRFPSGVFTQTTVGSTGDAGNIRINAERLTIADGAAIAATTFGTGNGGNVRVDASQLQIANGSILSGVAPSSSGNSGTIALQTGALSIQEGGVVQTQTLGRGDAGQISIRADDALSMSGSGSRISTQVSPGAVGAGGALNIRADRLTLSDQAQISAATSGQGNAGRITAQINGAVRLSGRAAILSSVNSGAAGSGNTIDIRAETIALQNGAQLGASTAAQGNAGTVRIRANRLDMTQGGQILSSTSSRGNARNIELSVLDEINLSGNNTGLFANTEPNSTGRGGNITIATEQLDVQDQAEIAVNSLGTGRAGNVAVTASTLLSNRGRITAETLSSQGGNIDLQIADRLDLDDRSLISSSTQDGEGGQLTLNANQAPTHVNLDRSSRITTEATGSGSAGDLILNASQLTLQRRSNISASNLSSRTGGTIRLRGLDALQLNNSDISATTQTGRAGNLIVNAANGTVQLQNQAGLSVEATDGGTAGSLRITADQLTVDSGAIASVRSPRGQAGNLTINASTVALNQGELNAETGSPRNSSPRERRDGAILQLQGLDLLILQNRSSISALATGSANGGNITLNADDGFILAVPSEDSDIIASAEQGNGGQIGITTQGVFGLEVNRSPIRLSGSEINASSEAGINGTITINTPDVTIQETPELPTAFSTPPLAQGCRSPGSQGSSFVSSGRGGLPANPADPLTPNTIWQDIQTVVEGTRELNELPPIQPSTRSLIEAQGWAIDRNGKVILTAQAAAVTPNAIRTAELEECDRER
ncbi:filamentous hemagglutinin N-terminal domain-containing protein [Phormidium tenue FACHB-886]|nr:filamentous hemagglutinin N-terminal domain-containing protein [Phormidium tenue FACHB-886]